MQHGAPLLNVNGLKTGSKLKPIRLTVGNLPRQMLVVRREGAKYRRLVEDETIKAKGKIGLTDAHLIDTASAGTIQAGICRWLLRERINDMQPAEILACTQALLKGKQTRDAAIRALDLDRDRTQDMLDMLYGQPWPTTDSQATEGEPDAADATPRDPVANETDGQGVTTP
jgi:hypothetical protein